MLDSDIKLFANSYQCPLDKRCEDCALKNFSDLKRDEIYPEILKLEISEKVRLVSECEECQDENNFL